MKVIILAAGMGERLFPLTRNTPKSLLDLGGGVTVIESQIDNIRAAGVHEVVIVTGYKSEQIEAKVASVDDVRVQVVYNPFFEVSNNLVSAWFAREHMNEDFIILNGDDVFESSVMENLIGARGPITMVVDHKDTYDMDDMKVRIEDGRIVEVGKVIDPDAADGESVGMILFRGAGRDAMRNTLDRMVRFPHYRKVFYLQAIQKIIDEGIPVNTCVCLADQWAEIDFHPDLSFIRHNIAKFNDVVATWKDA